MGGFGAPASVVRRLVGQGAGRLEMSAVWLWRPACYGGGLVGTTSAIGSASWCGARRRSRAAPAGRAGRPSVWRCHSNLDTCPTLACVPGACNVASARRSALPTAAFFFLGAGAGAASGAIRGEEFGCVRELWGDQSGISIGVTQRSLPWYVRREGKRRAGGLATPPPGRGDSVPKWYQLPRLEPSCYGAAIHALGARARRSRRVRHGLKVSR